MTRELPGNGPEAINAPEGGERHQDIAIYTEMTWGREQRKKYTHGLRVCVDDIVAKPALRISRDEFHPGLRSILYGEHITFFLPTPEGVAIIRVLHQTMNVSRWLAPADFVDAE